MLHVDRELRPTIVEHNKHLLKHNRGKAGELENNIGRNLKNAYVMRRTRLWSA